jgi:hypothetical protein
MPVNRALGLGQVVGPGHARTSMAAASNGGVRAADVSA